MSGTYIVVERFLDARHGWVRNETGPRVTVDGGVSWQPAAWDDRVQDPYFVDADHGWNLGNGFPVTRTLDGGRTWIKVTLPKGISSTDRAPYFTDPLHGYLLAHRQGGAPLANAILATADGGKTWTSRPAKVPPPDGVFLERRIYFFDSRHGFLEIWGVRSMPLYRTADGGASWQSVSLERPATASGGSAGGPPFAHGARIFGATDAVIGWIWADPSSGSEVTGFYTTHDAGQTWILSAAQAGSGPVAILGPAHWLFATTTALRETTDAGRSWHDLAAANLPQPLRWLDFADEQHGWAGVGVAVCTGMGPCPALQLYGTTDGGQSWQQLHP